MPNWCEGSIRVKGARKNVFKFFTEGVGVYESYYVNNDWVSKLLPESKWLRIEYSNACYCDYVSYLRDNIYIKGTRRAFLSNAQIICFDKVDDDAEVIVAVPIRQAWDFCMRDWIDISKKFDLDIKLYGIESGGAFIHEIEIENGQPIKDNHLNSKSYNDFMWNCPFPWMGG